MEWMASNNGGKNGLFNTFYLHRTKEDMPESLFVNCEKAKE
jgi:hypothetical protein